MLNVGELIAEVQDKLLDSSFSDSQIIQYFNQCIRRCSHVLLLPALESEGTFDTNPLAMSVDLPVSWNFHKNLYSAKLVDGTDIQVVSSMALMRDHAWLAAQDLQAGDLEAVAIQDQKLVYYKSPAEVTTVYCKFFRLPDQFDTADLAAVNTMLPATLADTLYINYALWKAWENVEDGVEDPKINTAYYKSEFNEAFGFLSDTFDRGQSQSVPRRTSGWI